MRARRPIPRVHIIITALLVLLAVVAAILWFGDPAHQWPGNSRVEWPATTSSPP